MTLKELIQDITKKEWQFVILLIVVIIVITTGPYLYAYFSTPQGHFYNGIHALTVGDYSVYFSYINQIKAGSWTLKNFFTSENQTVGVLNLFWLKIGLLARIFNLAPALAFHLARILLIPVLLSSLYIFVSYFWQNKLKRKISLLFLLFSSGIGGFSLTYFAKVYSSDPLSLIYKWPIDFWVVESNIFLILYHSPHLILSLSLMIIFFLMSLLALDENNYWYSFYAGLIGLYWFNWHPYFFPYVFIVLFIYLLVLSIKTKKWRLVLHFLLSLGLSSPFVVYHYYLIKTNELIGIRASQNITLTPPFLFVFLGFGFLLIFAALGIIYLLKNKKLFKNNKYLFLLIWLISSFILIYSPFNWQRRLLMGLQVPLVIFTVYFIFSIPNLIKRKVEKVFMFIKDYAFLLIFLFLIFFGFSIIVNLTRDFYYFKNHQKLFYLPNEYKTATDWLENNNSNNKAILAYKINGNIIPGFINQPVFLGHSHETINYNEKLIQVVDFFSDKYNNEEATNFMLANNIGYIFMSDFERLNGKLDPTQKEYLTKVWQEGQIEIYKFNQP